MIFNRPKRRQKKQLTWYFNSKFNILPSLEFSAKFRSANSNRLYDGIIIKEVFMAYKYGTNQQQVYMLGKWKDEAYRTITFEEEPTGDLLAFLEANATPQ